MVVCAQIWALPPDVHRILFRFLGVKDALRYSASCAYQAPALREPTVLSLYYSRGSNSSSNSSESGVSIAFHHEWRIQSSSIVRKWVNMVGPITHAILDGSLTSSVADPVHLNYLFVCLSPWLHSVAVDITHRSSDSSSNPSFPPRIKDPAETPKVPCPPTSEAAAVESAVLPALHVTSMSVVGKSPQCWVVPYEANDRVYAWIEYLLRCASPVDLVSLSIDLDLSYLRAAACSGEACGRVSELLYRFRRLSALSLRVQADPADRFSQGLCSSLTDYPAAILHKRLFRTFIAPALHTALRVLTVAIVLPEAILELRRAVRRMPEDVQRLDRLVLEVQTVPTIVSQRKRAAEDMMKRRTAAGVHELQETMKTLGFSNTTVCTTAAYTCIVFSHA